MRSLLLAACLALSGCAGFGHIYTGADVGFSYSYQQGTDTVINWPPIEVKQGNHAGSVRVTLHFAKDPPTNEKE